jgi:hypothetical protein
VIEYAPKRETPFRLLSVVEGKRWSTPLLQEPTSFKPVTFGSGRFQLALDGQTEAHPGNRGFYVADRAKRKVKPIFLPQSTYEQFYRRRPERVKDGYTKGHTEMNEQIGPWQIADDTLWFAKTFYDSEGMSGVGGFGYFDVDARAYRIFSPEEVRHFSASTMMVENHAVWLGLVQCSEWAARPGGLLRFDRETKDIKKVRFHEIITSIHRAGDALVLGSDMGVAVLEGGKVRRFFVDETTDGRLRMAEAVNESDPAGVIN